MSDDNVRPFKRPMKRPTQLVQIQPKDTPERRPRWLVEALQCGEVRCPRKWSEIATELCSQLQERDPHLCREKRCAYSNPGIGEAFRREAAASRQGIPPKIGLGSRTRLQRVASDYARGEGDFADGDDE